MLLGNGHLEAEERKGYLYVRLTGELPSVGEVERVIGFVRDRMAQASIKKLLLDVRQLRLPLPDAACQAAWQFIHAKEYGNLACTFGEETGDLLVTRINMTGLSASLPFRAFANIVDAHRWLELRPSGIHRRMSSMAMPAVSGGSTSSFPAVEAPPPSMSSAAAATGTPPNGVPSQKKRPSTPPAR